MATQTTKKSTAKKPATKAATKKAGATKQAAATKTASPKAAAKTASPKPAPAAAIRRDVDKECPLAGKASVHADYDAMLNQTNIGANNNKFYVIQLLEQGGKYHVWNRWGRVGESGQSALKGPFSLDDAIKEFEGKFSSKTGNKWSDRGAFKAKAGKYTLIEIEGSADEETENKLKELDKKRPVAKTKPSDLPASLQAFIKLIFDRDMFASAMADLELDTKKMPLGQLSQAQVQRGFGVLEELEEQLERARTNPGKLAELSSRFYTVIPHSFGRRVPPVIGTKEMLQAKMDMLNVLSDIETALGMEDLAEQSGTPRHPLDEKYETLKARLSPVDKSSDAYGYVERYLEATRGRAKHELVDVFEVDRGGEGKRFTSHDGLENRKLLWHGTNVAVVAAILKSGLRIMPHSGGRVGRGIYLASEQSKSAGYVGRAGRTGIMFLAEAALGKEHTLLQDDWRLKAAPKGFDSIVARGHTEPDPKRDVVVELEGRKVIVPQGEPIPMPQYKKSYFTQSEYLVYQESQVRLRYVLKLRM